MANMKFRMFEWPHDPEQFGIRAVCEPEYTENNIGGYDYTGMGPLCRVFTAKGVFCGPEAVQLFNGLAVIMATKTEGELIHPIWGTTTAYITGLEMAQESRPEYIVYTITFRETDEQGCIPMLPEQNKDQ